LAVKYVTIGTFQPTIAGNRTAEKLY